jgi:hypothetical protein
MFDLAKLNEREIKVASALAPTYTSFGASRWESLIECPTHHDLRYNKRVLPIARASYFGVGELVHAGQAWHYRKYLPRWHELFDVSANWSEVIDLCEAHLAMGADSSGSPLDPVVIMQARELLQAYFTHWGDDGGWGNYQPIDIELLMGANLSDDSVNTPCLFTGRSDTVRQDHTTQRIILVDTKTRSAKPPSSIAIDSGELAVLHSAPMNRVVELDYWAEGLHVRPQFRGLSYLATAWYENQGQGIVGQPISIVTDVIIKTKQPRFGRVQLDFTYDHLNRWRDEHIKMRELTRLRPFMNFGACAPEIGSRCEYFEHCHHGDTENYRQFTQST